MKKNLNKLEIKGNFLNMMKGIYINLLAKSNLMVKKNEYFPVKTSSIERISSLLTSIQHGTEGPDHYYKVRKRK